MAVVLEQTKSELISFEIGLKLINDYHLKEVLMMPTKPGLDLHSRVIDILIS
jgi:hypothetical protein